MVYLQHVAQAPSKHRECGESVAMSGPFNNGNESGAGCSAVAIGGIEGDSSVFGRGASVTGGRGVGSRRW